MQETVNDRKSWYFHYVLRTFSIASVPPDPFAPSTHPLAAENECSHGNLGDDRVINCGCWDEAKAA